MFFPHNSRLFAGYHYFCRTNQQSNTGERPEGDDVGFYNGFVAFDLTQNFITITSVSVEVMNYELLLLILGAKKNTFQILRNFHSTN